ncbi:sodium:glutamate symporter [Fusibacter paucivorans]|uniref:Sodium:glutamate symporter n=2 Tax=Fusibacter paucivorans TaxID=76009 RepID=A0ABS5PSE6_9FIRM|nr:sodium:glutamate symporter [Fusibacter paucivorans]
MPTAILAGFIGMLLGPEVLGIVPFDQAILGNIVYHAMAIGFIALSLKSRTRETSPIVLKSGMLIVSVYMLQGIIGIVLTLIFMASLKPDLFVGFGLLLPLGYGQGPGQAFSMGSQWEKLGFQGGGNIGLTIATFGFLWAILIGIPFMNYHLKRHQLKAKADTLHRERSPYLAQSEPDELPLGDALDHLTPQIVLIGIVYLATYLSILFLDHLISPMGTFGKTFVTVLWGMQFNIAAGYAIIVRLIMDRWLKKGILKRDITNNYLLQRISGGVFDYMITAAIAAISISAVQQYWLPTVLMTTLGGVVTLYYLKFMVKRVYQKNTLENLMGFYGMLTGTISTGMALLRGTDPEFDTDAASNLVFGSAVGMAFGTPLLVIINIPIMGYVDGNTSLYGLTIGLLAGYLSLLVWLMLRRRQA